MAHAKVLVVEDEAVVALALQTQLDQLGFQVAGTCSTGKEAVELASRLAPDLVLMDIRLEGEMDGIEAAQHIRSLFDVPVVFLTAYSDESTVQRAKVSEPFGYILKPFDERMLKSTIEISLHRHKMETARKDLTSGIIEKLVRERR